MVHKIVSGGQTGVDRAALDFGLENGIPCGGWYQKAFMQDYWSTQSIAPDVRHVIDLLRHAERNLDRPGHD